MSKGLKVLLIICLLLPGRLCAQDTAEILMPDVTADIDTVVSLNNAPYLWDQAVPMDADTVEDYDEASSLLIRKVPADVRDKFAKDKSLQYRQLPPKKETSFNWGWTYYLFRAIAWFVTTFWVVIVIVVLAAMGIALFMYLRKNGYVFKRSKVQFDEQLLPQDDTDYDFNGYEKQIQQAVAEGKLRLAVRLMYLQTLWLLADKGIIAYSKEKTNAAYLRSMSQTQWHKPFARLTVDYEYIWYGEVPVNNEQFRVIQGQFSQFMNDLGYTR